MISPQQLAHVVLRTGQKDVLTTWYLEVLGARLQQDAGNTSFLTFDAEHHRIAIVEMPDAVKPARSSSGLAHMAFTFKDLGDLLNQFDHLRNEGIEPFWSVNHGTTASLYYRDPDGNVVELQADNFPTSEEGAAYLRSDRFVDNPIGVVFDPEAFLGRVRAGVLPAELAAELATVSGDPAGPPGSGWATARS
jgi:catechol 2,3-dioxygenase-like lactoylglutathione lyase family enzyme